MSQDPHRQTGRTTRMIAHAKALKDAGERVVIIAATRADAWRIEKALGLYNLGSEPIVVRTPQTAQLCFESMTVNPAFDRIHPRRKAIVLVDHFAIESYLTKAIAMMHAYDAEPQPKTVTP
jgi:molybdopterin-guanine dinucleotide biosynthesis protein